jgi:hypothetical protein
VSIIVSSTSEADGNNIERISSACARVFLSARSSPSVPTTNVGVPCARNSLGVSDGRVDGAEAAELDAAADAGATTALDVALGAAGSEEPHAESRASAARSAGA